MPYQLRQLLGIILVYSLPSNPLGLWERFKNDLKFGLDVDDRKVEYKTLQSLDSILRVNGKTLENYGLPVLQDYELEVAVDEQVTGDLIQQELNAYPLEQLEPTAEMVTRLNANQQDIFDQVISAIETPEMGMANYFIDNPGGTGKSFLLEQILAKIRLEGGIAVVVASSGIAATLLTGGRTAHSMFKIPLKPNEHSTCGISKQSQKAKLIRQARLIIWDEAPMMHRSCFEAVDRTFRDIMDNDTEPFGGKWSGDHRQILPVLKNATRAETVKACFKASPLWGHLRQVHLTEIMLVKTAPDPDGAASKFSDFLLQIGEGRFPSNPDIGEGDICIPRDMCLVPNRQVPTSDEDYSSDENAEVEIPNFSLLPQSRDLDHSCLLGPEENRRLRTANALIDAVYPEIGDDDLLNQYFVGRAILAPTNASVRRINEMVADRLPGETKEYLSNGSLEGPLFEPEFLNSLNFSGLPPHKMVLKVGTPIIMIRNLNSADGLCNGTRLRVVALRETSINATIMTGSQRSKRVFIPCIVFFRNDEDIEFPFRLRCKQFPVVPAFTMTINKAQGQSIHHIGIYLESPVFAHGQRYVALSWVTSRKAIKIAIDPEAIDEDGNMHTKNIVYREIFQ
ncbi:LOW QUALITY PROTEIN: Helitron helicase-like protein [Phytophthora palmivora]|uniref:ATP-dependent DNA helicase n=1 Tax=Phytophthora palmivora TaxID=4796 RepID=A0A2P4Y7P9_9STRA|nr:LOW QUALITY PROTEIN: Helitron helicase-like protein [Phytophthora palmivora]